MAGRHLLRCHLDLRAEACLGESRAGRGSVGLTQLGFQAGSLLPACPPPPPPQSPTSLLQGSPCCLFLWWPLFLPVAGLLSLLVGRAKAGVSRRALPRVSFHLSITVKVSLSQLLSQGRRRSNCWAAEAPREKLGGERESSQHRFSKEKVPSFLDKSRSRSWRECADRFAHGSEGPGAQYGSSPAAWPGPCIMLAQG